MRIRENKIIPVRLNYPGTNTHTLKRGRMLCLHFISLHFFQRSPVQQFFPTQKNRVYCKPLTYHPSNKWNLSVRACVYLLPIDTVGASYIKHLDNAIGFSILSIVIMSIRYSCLATRATLCVCVCSELWTFASMCVGCSARLRESFLSRLIRFQGKTWFIHANCWKSFYSHIPATSCDESCCGMVDDGSQL